MFLMTFHAAGRSPLQSRHGQPPPIALIGLQMVNQADEKSLNPTNVGNAIRHDFHCVRQLMWESLRCFKWNDYIRENLEGRRKGLGDL